MANKDFNKLNLFWIVPISLIVIIIFIIGIIFVYFNLATPYNDNCIAWRFQDEQEMNEWYTENYGETFAGNKFMWTHTCPDGYVCVNDLYKGTFALSEGHYKENPAEGKCSAGVGGLW